MSGHPLFAKLTEEEQKLHDEKNADYAGGGDPLGNFKRVSAILGQYNLDLSDPAVVAMVYAMKQIDAVLWMKSQGYDGSVENIDSRLMDVHVYMKLARILEQEEPDLATAAGKINKGDLVVRYDLKCVCHESVADEVYVG